MRWDLIWYRGSLVFAVGIFLFATGCVTLNGSQKKTAGDGLSESKAVEQKQNEQIVQLQSREKELEKEISRLKAQLEVEKAAFGSLTRRFEAAQAAREDAIREVVRMRARIQGMASLAEASAMFAEARVILDRMEDEAYNTEASADLDRARSYMARGKGALDSGNPGGAAYLFDLIPGLYEGMKKGDPRMVQVNVSIAALRESPKKTAPKVGSLYWGDSATGIEKSRNWMNVKASSGLTGWIMKSQVQ